MKNLLSLSLMIFIVTSALSQNLNDSEIVFKTKAKLASFKTIQYDAYTCFSLNNGQSFSDTIKVFFDWTNASSLIDYKYRFAFGKHDVEHVYNGKILYEKHAEEERVVYTEHPKLEQMCTSMGMDNSIYLIKQILSAYKNDSTVIFKRQNDTIVSDKNCYRYNISFLNKRVDLEKGFEVIEAPSMNMSYSIAISKNDFMPMFFMSKFSNGNNASTFANIVYDQKLPESTWTAEHFPKGYLFISKADYRKSQDENLSSLVGQLAPDWTLPSLAGNDVALSNLKGKVILLEFWFPYCGGCVTAIPHIKEISATFKEKGLEIYGIEFLKNKKDQLKEYADKYNIEIPTLYAGENVAKTYSVYGAPAFFLIDKTGKIVYAKLGLEKEGLIAEINKNLP